MIFSVVGVWEMTSPDDQTAYLIHYADQVIKRTQEAIAKSEKLREESDHLLKRSEELCSKMRY